MAWNLQRLFFKYLAMNHVVSRLALLLLVTASASAQSLPEGARALRNLAYVANGHERHKLDLYLPANTNSPVPLIIWVHGGAWSAGSKERPPGLRFLSRGYAVASINYRLSQHAVFPAQIEDCKAAVRWLRTHASEYGLDPGRFGAMAALPATAFARVFHTEEAAGLFGGIAAHGFGKLTMPFSSSAGIMLGGAGHAYGWPVAKGGSQAITDAMVERRGSERRTVALPVPTARLPVTEGDRVDVWATADPASVADGAPLTRRVAVGARVAAAAEGSVIVEVAPRDVAALADAAATATITLVGVR